MQLFAILRQAGKGAYAEFLPRSDMRKRIITEWIRIIVGLFIFSLGVHLTIFANIGLAPWDCLSMGLSYKTPLSFGLCVTIISVAVLMVDLLLKERIGYGTVIDALITGTFIQFYNDINPFPLNESLWKGALIILGGFVIMAIGMAIYMKAAQSCGPRDSLLVGLGKRMPKVPIGIVQIIISGVVLLIGWLLGGPVGLGTVISTFGGGLVMQFVYSVIHFEPRDIKHRDIVTVTKQFISGKEDVA